MVQTDEEANEMQNLGYGNLLCRSHSLGRGTTAKNRIAHSGNRYAFLLDYGDVVMNLRTLLDVIVPNTNVDLRIDNHELPNIVQIVDTAYEIDCFLSVNYPNLLKLDVLAISTNKGIRPILRIKVGKGVKNGRIEKSN